MLGDGKAVSIRALALEISFSEIDAEAQAKIDCAPVVKI